MQVHSPDTITSRIVKSRLLILTLVSLIIAIGILVSPKQAVAQGANNTPIVVVRIDDCRANWRTSFVGLGGKSGLQYGQMKHIPITWGVVSYITSNTFADYYAPYYLTWSELRAYLDAAGGEPASHSVMHAPMSSDAAYISELANSKAAIQQNLPGYTCNTFLEPGEWTGDANIFNFTLLGDPVGLAMQADYTQSQDYLGAGWHVGPIFYRYGLSADWQIDNTTSASIPQIQATLNEVAATPGLVFVITGHGVCEQGQKSAYSIPADFLKAFMDTLDSMRNQGLIRIMSMNDAYNATLDTSLNLIPDQGFETCNPGPQNPDGPWMLSGNSRIVSTGGTNNSRYVYMPDPSSYFMSLQIVLNPGDYLFKWYQKSDNGVATNKNVYVTMQNFSLANIDNPPRSLYRVPFQNSANGVWEQKSALIKSHSNMPFNIITFASDGGFGIDNLSVTSIPMSPSVAPTQFAVNPSVTTCPVSWLTPTDPTVTSMVVRYSWSTFPQKPTDGMPFGSVAPIPGTIQSVAKTPWYWNFMYAYFSVFAVKADGSYSSPDFDSIDITVPPPAPTAAVSTVSSTQVSESWSDSSTVGVHQYAYANGTTPEGTDITLWTNTTQSSALASIPATATQVYLSVKAQDLYGNWSPVTTTAVTLPWLHSNQQALQLPDGRPVTWTGIVTAVFGNSAYIEDSGRARGIQVRGAQTIQSLAEGNPATVSGTMTTIKGERVIQCN